MVHVEDLAFIHGQGFDAVLVGVGVDRFLEGLTQNVLAALGVGDQAVHGQHQVVGDQAVGGGEEAEVAFDDAALVFGQAVLALPQSNVGVHVHFLRHPVVGATIQILLPGPVVLEGYELVEVGAGVDHLLVADLYAGAGAFQLVQTFLHVEGVEGLLGAGDGVGVVGGNGAGVFHGAGGFVVEADRGLASITGAAGLAAASASPASSLSNSSQLSMVNLLLDRADRQAFPACMDIQFSNCVPLRTARKG